MARSKSCLKLLRGLSLGSIINPWATFSSTFWLLYPGIITVVACYIDDWRSIHMPLKICSSDFWSIVLIISEWKGKLFGACGTCNGSHGKIYKILFCNHIHANMIWISLADLHMNWRKLLRIRKWGLVLVKSRHVARH